MTRPSKTLLCCANKAAFSVKFLSNLYWPFNLSIRKANFKVSRTLRQLRQAFVIDLRFLFDNHNLIIEKLLKDSLKFEIGLEKHSCANKASFSVKILSSLYRPCRQGVTGKQKVCAKLPAN